MRKLVPVVFVTLFSCALPVWEPPSQGESSGGSTGSGPGTGEPDGPGPASTGPGTSSGGETGDGSGSTGSDTCTFICEETAGESPGFGCDTFTQDCPTGEKCTTAWIDSEFRNLCVQVQAQAKAVGESCIQLGDIGPGVDECMLGSLCWDPDPVTGIGMCVELCGGTADAAVCDTPNTFCAYGKSLQLCLQNCEPRDLETCPIGCTCIPGVADNFMCGLNASGELGAYADPCEFINMCDPGNVCIDSALSGPDCEPGSTGCCMPVCDTAAPVCPHPDLECMPWYEAGTAPAGSETLGVCAVP